MAASSVCAGCQRPIHGPIVDALGVSWHPQHFVCARCAAPIREGRFAVVGTRAMHERCAGEAATCAICHARLSGRFLADYWGNRYCPEHQAQYPPCPYCSRLMAAGSGAPSGDPVRRCRECLASAVLDYGEALRQFASARQWVSHEGVLVREGSVEFQLIDRRELERLLGDNVGQHSGITRATAAFGRAPRITVSMVRGLPRALFAGACVHELGHVWLRQHAIDRLAPSDEEGFCELLAWRYYGSRGTPDGRYHCRRMEEANHPIYSEGFRQARRLSERYGFGQLVNLLAYYQRMPQ